VTSDSTTIQARPARRARLVALLALAAVMFTGAVAAPAAQGAVKPTGRYLVAFERSGTVRSASALGYVLERAGARKAGRTARRIGIAPVTGPLGAIAALRRDPRVESVSREYTRELRRVPNDPALRLPESGFSGVPAGTPVQWALARERFPAAWDISTGTGATVAVLDTGIDGAHRELGSKIFYGAEYGTDSGAFSDREGHGTHVSGLACAETNNGIAVAGAGWNCKVGVEKIALLRDDDVINAIEHAALRGVHAINMSFGGGPESAAIDRAIDFAVERNVVLVGSASNSPDTDQGSPAAQLQKDASNINAGRGLVVTAADFSDRNAGTGRGDQISVAAYGFFDDFDGPPGLISTFPGNNTAIGEGLGGCGCRSRRFGGNNYAYLQGTSMAAPQVAALAALVGQLNPFLRVGEKTRIIKQTARGGGRWNPELGWGIIDAGRALDATRRVDRTAPRTRSRSVGRVRLRRIKRGRRKGRLARTARVRLRLLGSDKPGAPGLLPSGLRSFDLYIARVRKDQPLLFKRVRRHRVNPVLRLRLKRGRYRFYSRALDNAGNREAKPPRWDGRSIVIKPRRKRRR